MAKIIDIKTKREITEPKPITTRQLADKLYEAEEALNNEGFEEIAAQIRKAIGMLMPTVVREKRSKRHAVAIQ